MSAPPAVLGHVLLALAAIVAVGHGLGRLFARLGQPPVIGQVVAGIVLGPSVLGAASMWILPPDAAPYLGIVAQLGVVLYMFTVGLELDLGALRARRWSVGGVALGAIAVPFALGAALALVMGERDAPAGVATLPFVLFIGVAMAITAFPVLARIVADVGLSDTPLGRLALGAAALGDVAAWCLLAVVVGVATARPGDALWVVGGAAACTAVTFLVACPWLRRRIGPAGAGETSSGATVALLAAALTAAAVTEAIGIHALFGAFLVGAAVPHDSAPARDVPRRLAPVVDGLLLPAFFAFAGMRTSIGLLDSPGLWALCAAVIAVATVGKVGGTLAAARLAGYGWRDGLVLGALMNTRGLMELIVLNVGLELGILSPTVFAVMVLMAVATTMMTAPVVRGLLRAGAGAGAGAGAR